MDKGSDQIRIRNTAGPVYISHDSDPDTWSEIFFLDSEHLFMQIRFR